jgi:hypothetical protein
MMQVLYSVFEMDGEKWVADTSICLTSNPPKYNCYSLKDKRHSYVECSKITCDEYMYRGDFNDWMLGYKYINQREDGTMTYTQKIEPIVYKREPSELEKLEARVKELEDKVSKLTGV